MEQMEEKDKKDKKRSSKYSAVVMDMEEVFGATLLVSTALCADTSKCSLVRSEGPIN